MPGVGTNSRSRPSSSSPRRAWRRSRNRKSTRLNSSHLGNSYALFCLKKKRKQKSRINDYIKFNLTIPLQQLDILETLVLIIESIKYPFFHITRMRYLNERIAIAKFIC